MNNSQFGFPLCSTILLVGLTGLSAQTQTLNTEKGNPSLSKSFELTQMNEGSPSGSMRQPGQISPGESAPGTPTPGTPLETVPDSSGSGTTLPSPLDSSSPSSQPSPSPRLSLPSRPIVPNPPPTDPNSPNPSNEGGFHLPL
jgi:hypothetical protein